MTDRQSDSALDTARKLGARLRAARIAANLRLADVAARAGLSESSLSRIERGHTALSITHLVQLCEILSVGVDELFDDRALPARTSVAVHRAEDAAARRPLAGSGYSWVPLAGGAPFDAFQVFRLTFPTEEKMKVMVSHPGQEYCQVLSGTVHYHVAGETHLLRPGDGIMIDSELPHRAESVGDRPAEIIMMVARPNAGAMTEWWNAAALAPSVQGSEGEA
ncbi:helix-turn-helix domain-containing protein [Acuticoccus mangrovi]|uniref:Helix-turn-helix domain-containing protein n=1 Tax=Acuticoccus mangrovi TaxID=2796142 RepID=A0A934MFM7_9HYPH|nr:XRE family transcriptional regulator [Acuticoccus mangrovi]MBJ3774056.1 helix-turn-helix domain-containing protein [Acuticoccus mangrovi]